MRTKDEMQKLVVLQPLVVAVLYTPHNLLNQRFFAPGVPSPHHAPSTSSRGLGGAGEHRRPGAFRWYDAILQWVSKTACSALPLWFRAHRPICKHVQSGRPFL